MLGAFKGEAIAILAIICEFGTGHLVVQSGLYTYSVLELRSPVQTDFKGRRGFFFLASHHVFSIYPRHFLRAFYHLFAGITYGYTECAFLSLRLRVELEASASLYAVVDSGIAVHV